MRLFLTLGLLSLMLGCQKKYDDTRRPTIRVVDYITGAPIETAEVIEKRYWGWSLSCFCYQGSTETLVGYTNPEGSIEHMTLDFLVVKKSNYYVAEKFNFCNYDISNNTATYGLFKKGSFEITARTTNSYTGMILLYVYPILKNGKIPEPYSAPMYAIQSTNPFIVLGYGGMNNRVFVLKSGTTDTLYKEDIFLAEGSTKQVMVNY